jgi:hypothetical protein
MNNPRLLLVIGALVLVGLAAIVVLLGRALRSRVSGAARESGGASTPRAREWAVTPLPTGMARTLTERGLVNAQQLANMSAAEREFFVATVAAKIGEGTKPKLVGSDGSKPGSASAPTPMTEPGTTRTTSVVGNGTPQDPSVMVDTVTTAALVSGPIYCPVCRNQLAERSETPLLMSRCPGCGRRVGFRVEGNRLTITVQYGAPTPAAGNPVVRKGR